MRLGLKVVTLACLFNCLTTCPERKPNRFHVYHASMMKSKVNMLGFRAGVFATMRVLSVLSVLFANQNLYGQQQTPSEADPLHRAVIENTDLFEAFKKDGVPVKLESQPTWAGKNKCGLNALYAFLRLSGNHISYSKLVELAGKVPEQGYNLEQLEAIAEKAGTGVAMLKGSMSEFSRQSPPILVHFGEPGITGHFVCYAKSEGGVMVFLDGTSGATFTIGDVNTQGYSNFLRSASGYMLVGDVAKNKGYFSLFLRVGSFLFFLLAIIGFVKSRNLEK